MAEAVDGTHKFGEILGLRVVIPVGWAHWQGSKRGHCAYKNPSELHVEDISSLEKPPRPWERIKKRAGQLCSACRRKIA
jgi:hypothetical protein